MPQMTLTGPEMLARLMVTEAAVIALTAVIEAILEKPIDDLRDQIERNIAAFNHPDVQSAVPQAITELMRLVSLSKENITKLN